MTLVTCYKYACMKREPNQSREALLRAIDVLGGQSALARACNKKQGHVSHWIASGVVPAEHCPLIEKATRLAGSRVPCEELNPGVDWAELRRRPNKTAANG